MDTRSPREMISALPTSGSDIIYEEENGLLEGNRLMEREQIIALTTSIIQDRAQSPKLYMSAGDIRQHESYPPAGAYAPNPQRPRPFADPICHINRRYRTGNISPRAPKHNRHVINLYRSPALTEYRSNVGLDTSHTRRATRLRLMGGRPTRPLDLRRLPAYPVSAALLVEVAEDKKENTMY
ncbi:hypothetical protein EVAR_88364_1 [Eumeta japonica]|uniref:Uncharacterized protein n=1 Tax=Eumeta variegata TaxID=151549 RepID=A0A4C1XB76_EUMVA|nr:hypothetical protein EVAR_88364_1 [Eumeta japonica]